LVAEPQITRTALSLVLSGRMKPDSGTVSWEGHSELKSLRRHSALVDSPEINAPESHMKVRDLVAEDLSLVPVPIWRKRGIDGWLKQYGFASVADQWVDALDPIVRLQILARLSEEYHPVQLTVFDSPDRHGIEEAHWLQLLESMAHSHRNLAVVAVVSRAPACWQGPVAYVGQDNFQLEPAEYHEAEDSMVDGSDAEAAPLTETAAVIDMASAPDPLPGPPGTPTPQSDMERPHTASTEQPAASPGTAPGQAADSGACPTTDSEPTHAFLKESE